MIKFNGEKVRDKILNDLKIKIAALSTKPTLAVIWVGKDPLSGRYIRSKQRVAEKIGADFKLYQFSLLASEVDIINKIKELNEDKSITGILLQMPLPDKINRQKVIEAISAEKDVDGLRFCANLPPWLGLRLGSARQVAENDKSDFQPPAVLAILFALRESQIDLRKKSVAIIGQGFLIGLPLKKVLKKITNKLQTADENTENTKEITRNADVIISAVGLAEVIKPDMVKKNVVLIDAGTSEVNGILKGDIHPDTYKKSSFYTPVPGGIGPITVAMLYKNLIQLAEKNKK